MKTMKWLIKREMWENKGMLFWAPTVLASVIAALLAVATFMGRHANFSGDVDMADMNDSFTGVGTIAIEGGARIKVAGVMAQGYMAGALPLLMMLGFLVFFYCLNALHDERRDRSFLFWKSLPVSDSMTVLSKALLAVVVAPLITIAISTVLSLVLLFAGMIVLLAHGSNMFGAVLSSPDLYLAPLRLVGLLPVYVLWALPTVGWLLMVSSMARSKVFLWAVGTPVMTSLLLLWAEKTMHLGLNAAWFGEHIVTRILLGVAPGAWFAFDKPDHLSAAMNPSGVNDFVDTVFSASWATLGNANVWIGAAAGVAMLAVAIWMRRRREEG